ncbi:hypothetical protein M413DRAFT_26892 [Hebeloma cylindrosporum]|uniref:Uncharacterized protein n=1 Tax=Hebeloma cylindrosporum TaxID=76867 RepID=A0A0C3CH37_HEBCY|nr:hypothetical protein M413DRAFT_26892 [Hebeloma cylindrosporum h7]
MASQARSPSDLLVRIDLERRASFAARQTGGGTGIPQVPSQCQSICNPVNTVISAGCTPSSCCQASFEMAYFNCFLCVGQASGLTDYTEIQTVLDEVVNECALIGNDLPKLTFPGQNPNRTLSAVPNLPSSTGTASTSRVSQTTVTSVNITPAPYQSTVSAIPTTSNTPSTSSVSSLGVRSAQGGMLGVVLASAVVMMVLVELFCLG